MWATLLLANLAMEAAVPVHDLKIFVSALNGDDGRLRSLAGPDGIVCIASKLSSVFLVEVAADKTQKGTLATVGTNGGGIVMKIPLPRSFRVRHIDFDSEHFILTSADSRSVYGAPRQFWLFPKLIGPEHNSAYEEHLEEAFLATHLLPDRRPVPHVDVATTAMLGELHFGVMGYTLPVGDLDLEVSFDCAGPEKVAQLLPHARELVAAFDRIRRDGTEFLWAWGANGAESKEEKARFFDELTPNHLIVYRSGDFEIHFHFEDDSGWDFPDGYWPVVVFKANMTPVDVVIAG